MMENKYGQDLIMKIKETSQIHKDYYGLKKTLLMYVFRSDFT